MRDIIWYIKMSNNKIGIILFIFKVILSIPALIIHETSHLIAIILTNHKFKIYFKDWYFLSEVAGFNHSLFLGGCGFPIHLGDNKWKNLIIAIAPIAGILFYLFIIPMVVFYFYDPNLLAFYILTSGALYFVMYIKTFWLSQDDINTIKLSLSYYFEKYPKYFKNWISFTPNNKIDLDIEVNPNPLWKDISS